MKLVWDTSSLNVSAAIFENDRCLNSGDEFREKHQQSRLLFQVLEQLLHDTNLTKEKIKEIAVGIGPGSYTGLRVGLTVAKMWSFARGTPCYFFGSDKALERTQAVEPDALYPKVRFLHPTEDFSLVQDLNDLKPLYHNDHFA